MESLASQDPRSNSLYFDLNIWFRARKVTETFEKRAPESKTGFPKSTARLRYLNTWQNLKQRGIQTSHRIQNSTQDRKHVG